MTRPGTDFREAAGNAKSDERAPEATPRSEADAGLHAQITELAAQPAEEQRDAALSLWDEYRRIRRSADRLARETEGALFDCLREAFEKDPDSFAGTRLDQEQLGSRLAELLEEMEALAQPRAPVSSEGGVIDFAEHLQRTLLAGTSRRSGGPAAGRRAGRDPDPGARPGRGAGAVRAGGRRR